MKADDFSANRLAVDVQQTDSLRLKLKQSPKEGLKQVAQQFESLFLNMMLKSMRDASPQDGMMDSDQTRLYTSMLDQQLSQKLSTSGQLGFAKLIEQQLGRNLPGADSSAAATGAAGTLGVKGAASQDLGSPEAIGRLLEARRAALRGNAANPAVPVVSSQTPAEAAASATESAGNAGGSAARDFVNRVWPYAQEAAQATGVPAQFLVAHAALETGWGKSEIRRADGNSSYNLFGIKAGKNWSGATVEAATTEYVGGNAQAVKEKFRAYGSYAEAFRDYANLLQRPRFSGVVGQQDGTDFARSLQQAGYATDPMYADKLSRIINGSTLRQALKG